MSAILTNEVVDGRRVLQVEQTKEQTKDVQTQVQYCLSDGSYTSLCSGSGGLTRITSLIQLHGSARSQQ
jgi:hypothetical protein